MIFIEVELDHPLLREALRAVPEAEVEWIRNTNADGDWELVFWANGEELERFDTALGEDPTVTPVRSIDVGDQRLYQMRIIDRGADTDLYPVLVDVGGIVMSAEVTSEGWLCRFGFPDQDGVERFFESARRHGVSFHVHRVSELEDVESPGDHGLTDTQRETLQMALDTGYFEIPRETTLQDLSAELGISDNAVSQRLRRGMKAMLRNSPGIEAEPSFPR